MTNQNGTGRIAEQASLTELLAQANSLATQLEAGKSAPVADEKCMDDGILLVETIEAPRPYGGATSFSDLAEYQQGQKADFATQDLFYAYEQLVANIRADDEMDVKRKGAAIVAASRELSALLKSPEAGASQVGFREKIEKAVKAVGNVVLGSVDLPIDRGPQAMFSSFKDTSGEWRWLAIHSNKFRDRDKEIFPETAHKQYVAMADALGIYPELWLWHTPGSRIGYADFVEYHDGFMLSSGHYDEGQEKAAQWLHDNGEKLGVSHGYRYPLDEKEQGSINAYFTFEVSPLPAARASNPWVLFSSMAGKEAVMREDKRDFLVEVLGEEKAAKIDKGLTQFRKDLEEAGVDWKDVSDALDQEVVAPMAAAPAATPVTDALSAPVETPAPAPADAEPAPIAAAVEEPSIAEQVKSLTGIVTTLAEVVTELADGQKALQQTDAAKIATAMAPRRQAPDPSSRPSEGADNIVDAEKARKATEGNTADDAEKNPVSPYVDQLMGLTRVPQG